MSDLNSEIDFQKKGIFIVFEGVDGCGKSTQLELTAQWLRSLGKKVIETFEPGDIQAFNIRNIVLTDKNLDPTTELFLFLADRAEHVVKLLIPALKDDCFVLCDRYVESTIAYQSDGRFINKNFVQFLNKRVTMGLQSDLTVWIDTPVQTALLRKHQTLDTFDSQSISFKERVRQSYNNQYQEDLWCLKKRIFRVEGGQSIQEIQQQIQQQIKNMFL